MKSSLTIVALVATTIGLGTVLPALAQDAAPAAARQWQDGPRHMQMGPGRGMGPGGLLMLACSDKGAEALEIALVRMSHRLDLTADQQKLFDTFRTNALSTETKFADTCKADRPAASADQKPDLLERLKAGLTIDQARIEAMQSVLPDFEALYNSLTDTQKAALAPHRGMGMGQGGPGMGRWGQHDGRGPDRNGPPPAPQNS